MKRGGSVSGAVSLVMIFCVLCLAVFSVLTLATAERERGLSELSAQRAAEYYAADRRAVEIAAALAAGETPEDVEVESAVSTGPAGTVREEAFALPSGGDLLLEVRLEIGETGEITVLTWKTVYAGDWDVDDTITLWDGD